MSCETDTAVALRDAGHKVTPQRMLILSIIRHAREHLTATRVIEQVLKEYPYVDPSTVYRTLSSATEMGFVSETDMGAGDAEFEWIGKDRHHHLICKSCGHVTSLDNAYLNGLATALHEELDFEPDLGHFAIFGTCGPCRRDISKEE